MEKLNEVPLKVKTITGKDKDFIEKKRKDFEKEHFISHVKWATDTILLIFYWEENK